MITKRTMLLLWMLLLLIDIPTRTVARPITYYQYFSNWETTPVNQIIWFWTADTLFGPTRSNDYFAIKFSPQFYGPIISAQDRFIELNASPWFRYDPIFNAPRVDLPQSYPHLIERANVRIDNDEGRKMTRLVLNDGELEIYQYAMGLPADSLEHIETIEQLERTIVVVDGKAELYGVLSGTLTIYATDDIYLIDDIKYVNANDLGEWDNDEDPGGMLGIVSEGDIIIKDNWANGKANSERGRDIVINASLLALGESFTFEHQNNDWDVYQGPEPDERGYIFLKGGLAQWRRGFTHRSNHSGTGYGKSFHYDLRLQNTGPPGLGADFTGRFDHLEIPAGVHQLTHVTANRLTVDAGAEIILEGENPLIVRGNIDLNGTADNPIIFRNAQIEILINFIGDWGNSPIMNMRNVHFGENIDVNLNSNSIDINNCDFSNDVMLQGNINIDRSTFAGEVVLESFDSISVTHSIFNDGVTIEGNVADGNFVNNTVVGGSGEGILVRRFRSLVIANNIIAFNRWGIVNRDRDIPMLRYNDVFDNRHYDYSGCEAGEGSISVDPMFVNYGEGDYNLVWNSPCVDAGDTNSPLDADGSRADMGALAIDHELAVNDEAIIPIKFSVSAFPNPFNDVVKIRVSGSIIGEAAWSMFDIRGRAVITGKSILTGGVTSFEIHGKQLSSSGIYFLRLTIADRTAIVKLAYMQ